jgi:hypothetical protein
MKTQKNNYIVDICSNKSNKKYQFSKDKANEKCSSEETMKNTNTEAIMAYLNFVV